MKLNIRSVLKKATDSQDTVPLPEKEDAGTEDAAGPVEEAQTVAPVNAPTAQVEAPRVETPVVEAVTEEAIEPEEEEDQVGVGIGVATTLEELPPSIATAELEMPPAEQIRWRPAVAVHDTDWTMQQIRDNIQGAK